MGVFDHVLVRVQFGAHTFWIDPVEDLLPPGQLPSRSQGRRVLVLTDRGGELTKTPLSVSTDNVGHELRVFEMPDMGPARVTEVGGEGGAFSGAMRAQYRDTVQAELRAHMEKYVRGEYRNAKLGKLEFTDPTDLARPMRLTLVAEGSGSAYSNFTELQWYLHPGDVLDKVPDMLRQEDEAAPRQTPMMWHTPHVYEIENRITVPQGFDIPATPTDSVQQLGTATLITRRKQQGRTLSITFRFDSGKPLLTAEEFRSTRKAILAVRHTDGLTVNFPMAAMQKVEEGQHHAAVRELKALTEKFPRSGGHLSRLAVAYLEAGMQPAALRTAQRAVELAPQESLTYVVLARVLLRDELGRRTGASNAAAIAAYRRAIALDLEDSGYQRGLAEVLSLDSDGWLSDQPGALRAAAELFASAHKLNDTQGSAEQEALLLLRLGEMAEVERKLRARPASELRDYVLLAAVAAQRGAAAALKEAEELAQTDEERGKILDSAGRELGVVGRYALSRELRVAAVAADSSLAGMLPDEPLVHRDLPARNDPRSAVMQFVRAVATGHEPATPPWGAAMTRELARHVHHLKPSIDRSTLTREVAVDWVQGSYKNQVSEVSPGQWRVAASNPWRPEIFYVVLEAQEAKILGTARVPHALGRHVAALLAKKQLSPARRWLDQVLDDLDEDNADRNLGARLALFWGPSLPRTNDQAELAAAVRSRISASRSSTWWPTGRISTSGSSRPVGRMICSTTTPLASASSHSAGVAET